MGPELKKMKRQPVPDPLTKLSPLPHLTQLRLEQRRKGKESSKLGVSTMRRKMDEVKL